MWWWLFQSYGLCKAPWGHWTRGMNVFYESNIIIYTHYPRVVKDRRVQNYLRLYGHESNARTAQYRANNWPCRGKLRHLSPRQYFFTHRLSHKALVTRSSLARHQWTKVLEFTALITFTNTNINQISRVPSSTYQ